MNDENWLLDWRNPNPGRYDPDAYQDEAEPEVLTQMTGAGVSQTPTPAPAPDDGDHSRTDDTTESTERQAALLVGYVGAFPPPPQAHATGELVQFTMDGEPAQAPAHSVAETRLWLAAHGFKPDYTLWRAIDRAVADGQRRRRLEVYVADEAEDEPAPQAEGAAATWWGAACATPRIPEEKLARWREEAAKARPRPADEPFIPESGIQWRYRHPYSNY